MSDCQIKVEDLLYSVGVSDLSRHINHDRLRRIEEFGHALEPQILSQILYSEHGINVFKELMVFLRILSLLRKLTPSAIHFITIKPIVYGGIASRILRLDGVIFAVSGLGYVFSSKQLKAKLIQIK